MIEDILNERKKTHGDFNEVANISQRIKSCFHLTTNYQNMPYNQVEALDMIASKLARILAGNHNEPDHYRDIAGYATLVLKELEKTN